MSRSEKLAVFVIVDIAHQFLQDDTLPCEIKPLGNGLINDTLLVSTPTFSFVLQRINSRVFPEPEHITENMLILNHHVRQKNKNLLKLQIPDVLLTRAGASFYRDDAGDFWRALSFIEQTESLEALGNLDDARQTGFALGYFHSLISDLDPVLMKDTLPGFHITPDYLSHYQLIIQSLPAPASPESRYCIDFINQYEHITDDLESAKRHGLLPLRIIHGDPKLNNFLFDKHSKKVVSIIDLDTVKPGLIHYDIGDCLRSCCHRTDPQGFDLDICEAILTSYLDEAGTFFSEQDFRYLYPAIRLIPFELGLRFFTDFLEGNRYFKISNPEDNLLRAVEQFRLCESIFAQEFMIRHLVKQLHRSTRKS